MQQLKTLVHNKPYLVLSLIFIIAVILRLLYFPQNVYFGSDQARDAYYSLGITQGHLRVVGPGASFNNYIHHGVLYYYIFGPIYLLAQGSPYIPALIVNLLNAFGVIIIFFIVKNLFDQKTALLAGFLYAISFEQTQYAIFFSHPAPAMITAMLYYLGLTLLLFRGNSKGLILTSIAAALSTQFHFSMIFLTIMLPVFLLIYRHKIPKLKPSDIILSITGFLFFSSSFIIEEIRYHHLFLFISSLFAGHNSSIGLQLGNFTFAINRYIHDNFVLIPQQGVLGLVLLVILLCFVWQQKSNREKTVFLTLWFLIGCIAYLLGGSTTYYLGIGGSVSLLIIVAVIIHYLSQKNIFSAIAIILIIVLSNLYQIITINPSGPIDSVMSPTGMLLSNEQRAIDYIYQQAGKTPFSIHAITIPYDVKTTWDYLFNWYGKSQYGYVPVWGGEDALGSEGTLKVERARSKLPKLQFLIIEPLSGLSNDVVKVFFREEGYFTHLVKEQKFGSITVQTRIAY